jgi:hypothetical protein
MVVNLAYERLYENDRLGRGLSYEQVHVQLYMHSYILWQYNMRDFLGRSKKLGDNVLRPRRAARAVYLEGKSSIVLQRCMAHICLPSITQITRWILYLQIVLGENRTVAMCFTVACIEMYCTEAVLVILQVIYGAPTHRLYLKHNLFSGQLTEKNVHVKIGKLAQ